MTSWGRSVYRTSCLLAMNLDAPLPVASLIFHEHFSDSIVPAPSPYMGSMRVSFSEFTSNSYSDGPSLIEHPHF